MVTSWSSIIDAKGYFIDTRILQFNIVLLLALALVRPVLAQQDAGDVGGDSTAGANPAYEENEEVFETELKSELPEFGGSDTVVGTIVEGYKEKESRFHLEDWLDLDPYFAFKKRLAIENGFAFGVDYIALYQSATDSLGHDSAASHNVRLYGAWVVSGKDAQDTSRGALIWKVENRKAFNNSVAVGDFARELGYAGSLGSTYKDPGPILSNLYWTQRILDNKGWQWAYLAGIVDVGEYISSYGLKNPWTDFTNFQFSVTPSVALPSQGFGAAGSLTLPNNYYVQAGITDQNGNPEKSIGDQWDSFWNDHELIRHVEIGRLPGGWKDRYRDNTHVLIWQGDRRNEFGIDDGWGVSFSYSKPHNAQWLTFFRADFAKGGSGATDRNISTGLAFHTRHKDDVVGIGVSWSRPNKELFGTNLNDQYVTEVFNRIQLSRTIQVTPSFQLLIDPALNPEQNRIWIFAARIRVAL